VNAVNLLPPKHRPRTPTGGQQGSSYAVIGVLGVICVMVLLYVVTTNGINSNQEAIAKTQAETAQAKKRADSLASYGNFIQIKEQRVSSVKQLATGRLDWERLARGLAHVLPEKVWLISADASATGEGATGGAPAAPPAPATPPPGGGGAQGSSAPPAPAPSAPASKPSLKLVGCAARTPSVAVALVRLRHLPNVEDVELVSMEKPETAVTPSGPVGAAGGGGAASGQDCGLVKKKQSYKWEAKVTFKPQAGSTPTPEKKVPASLGGGA
jgi:hypothetical protein